MDIRPQDVELHPDQIREAALAVAAGAAVLGPPGWFIAGAIGLAIVGSVAGYYIAQAVNNARASGKTSAADARAQYAADKESGVAAGVEAETWADAVNSIYTSAQLEISSSQSLRAYQAKQYRDAGMWSAAEALELPASVDLLRTDLLLAMSNAAQQGYQATEQSARYLTEATLISGEAVARETHLLLEASNQNALLLAAQIDQLGGDLVISGGNAEMRATAMLEYTTRRLGTQIVDRLAVDQTLNARGIDQLRDALQDLEIRAGDVTVQAPPAPNVSVTAPVDTTALGIALAAAMPAIGVAMAQAISATAGPNAHAGQQARYGCMGGFAGSLLNVVRTLLPSAGAAGVLLMDSPLRTWLEDQTEHVITEMTDPARFSSPASEDTAMANAAARLTQAIGYGLVAQMMSYTAEAATPLKQMGFGQLAGFVGDLAGYKRIADGVMGAVEDAALYQPLRWKANRQFRPRLPNEQQLALMFQKRSLTRAELDDYEERLGLDDLYISRIPGFIYNDPSPSLLIRAFQLAPPGVTTPSEDDLKIMEIAAIRPDDPDWYYKLKFAKSGLDDTDVQAFVPVVKMGLLRREQTLRYDAITRMYRDGYISRVKAEAELRLAQTPGDITTYRLEAMDLQREAKRLNDTRAIVITSMARGLLTRAEAREQLTSLGMDGERVELEVLKGTLGLLPTQRITVAATEELSDSVGGDIV